MDERFKKAFKEKADCLLCGKSDAVILGIRGNREYRGADLSLEPHLFTNVVRCKNCDFIYTNPEIKGVEFLEREHYNNPEEYQADNSNQVVEMFEHRVNYLRKFKDKGNLLDVGAGKGEFVFVAERNGFNAIGIEPSQRFCEFAEKTYNVKVYQGFLADCEELKTKKFDVITLHHVLEHIENPSELLLQISKYLQSDGIIYIEVPNTDSIAVKLIDFYFRLQGKNWSCRLSPLHPPFHKYGYTPKSLEYLLKKCEFKIKRMETFSLLSRSSKNFIAGKGAAGLIKNLGINFLDAFGNRDMLTFVVKKAEGN